MNPFVGQIELFGGNFAPRGWAFCYGQLLAVSEHDALFSLLGTIYGGDGSTTFALPDLRGRCVIGAGHGPGLSDRRQGVRLGGELETMIPNHLPSHTHVLLGNSADGTTNDPAAKSIAKSSITRERGADSIPANGFIDAAATAPMHASNIGASGGDRSHNNMQPSLAVNYIIALFGIYPSPH
ncbi:phage tail protein [Algoriphagus aquimarinus]|uniref:Microcystin-dependent protein n=1 Tax=Algoriphagus aquimarinus TaxID=237018 RepID=A0A1I1BC40_9BACT|nr:tail fiber protein [Algoriphagus aquimarinus]SFB46073.1 Microcystin-dependent protein [Algoriphagus aquimarinus]